MDEAVNANKESIAEVKEEELALKEDKANKGVANGYAGLDADGKVPKAQLPELSISDYEDLVGKPTKLSDFVDDLGNAPVHTHSQYLTSHQDLSGKQDVLVPGEGIKIVGNTISSTVTGGANNYEDLVGKPTKLSDFVDDLGNTPVHTHEQYLTQHQDLSGKANVDMSNVSADVLRNLIGSGGSGSSGGIKETFISEDKNSFYTWFDNGLLIQQIHIPSRPWAFTVETLTQDYVGTTYTAVPTPVDWALPKAYSNTDYIIHASDAITAKNSSTVTLKIVAVEGGGFTQPTGISKAVDFLTVGYSDPTTT